MPRTRKHNQPDGRDTSAQRTSETPETQQTQETQETRREDWNAGAADAAEAIDERPGADGPIDVVVESAPASGPARQDDELARARAQAADYEDRWKRSAAEFINYKRRTEQERTELVRYGNRDLILALLPVLDDLERALAHVPADEAESEWVKGVRLVERKFRTILERQGITPIEAVGQPFDPALHEAVAGSGTVVTQEYQRGYRMHDRVLRPSMVVVGEAAAAAQA